MRCKKIEKWISDGMDGKLPRRISRKVSAHLADCRECRSYEGRLKRIETEARSLPMPLPGRPYWESSIERLKASLTAEQGKGVRTSSKQSPAFFRKPQLAWAGAASFFAVAAGLYLLLMLPGSKSLPEYMPASWEDGLTHIYEKIGDNPDLEAGFDTALQASIEEHAGEKPGEVKHFLYGNVDFVDSLSDEEIGLLEAAIGRQPKL
jgi:hypothetical protein